MNQSTELPSAVERALSALLLEVDGSIVESFRSVLLANWPKSDNERIKNLELMIEANRSTIKTLSEDLQEALNRLGT